jgi:hypothetical protein
MNYMAEILICIGTEEKCGITTFEMEQYCCGTCKFFTRIFNSPEKEFSDTGECIRYPPIFTYPGDFKEIEEIFSFPKVSYVRFCGEWQEREDMETEQS